MSKYQNFINFMNTNYQFKLDDSGQHEEFTTGAKRDTAVGKPRYDLIPLSVLKELAVLYQKGAEKYDERNWQKGIPLSRYYASFMRHFLASVQGKTDENHEAAMVFNVVGYVWTLRMIQAGELPEELDDRKEML